MATSRKNIQDAIRKKIIVMVAEGKTTAEIMKETGQTALTISKVCMDAGMRITRKQEKSTDEKRNLVLNLHGKGYSPTEITCETGVPVSTVRTYIRKEKQYEALLMIREAINMLIELH